MGLKQAVLDVLSAFSQHFGNPVKITNESVYFQIEDSAKHELAVLTISVRGPRALIDRLAKALKLHTYTILAEEGQQVVASNVASSNVAVLHAAATSPRT